MPLPSGPRLPQRFWSNCLRFGGGRLSGDLGPRPGRGTMRSDTKRHKPIRGKAAAQTEIPPKHRAGRDTSHRLRISRIGIRVPPGVPPKPSYCGGFAAPTPATVEDMGNDSWVVSWSNRGIRRHWCGDVPAPARHDKPSGHCAGCTGSHGLSTRPPQPSTGRPSADALRSYEVIRIWPKGMMWLVLHAPVVAAHVCRHA